MKKLIADFTEQLKKVAEIADIKEIYSKGNSILKRILYLVHWGDWVSYYLAERKSIETMDIKVITYLKSELAKVEEY